MGMHSAPATDTTTEAPYAELHTPEMKEAVAGRHTAIHEVTKWFGYSHLGATGQAISKKFHDLAIDLLDAISHDSPALTRALHALVLTKDEAVRAVVDQQLTQLHAAAAQEEDHAATGTADQG